VSDSQDMTSTLDAFVRRVQSRSHLEVVLDCEEKARLPLRQEREMWRIAQEAITNVEHHAKAKLVTVRWRCDSGTAELFVKDDGIGFPDTLDVKQTSSLGMLLITSLSRQLAGEVVMERGPGARCIVTFPDPAAVEA
jgi:signal transduction histidine kinase